MVSGCVIEPNGMVRVAPVVVAPPVVAVTAPAVEVAPPIVEVPDTYVWDGIEFVGLVGDQYFYLGPGNVWVVCDTVRLGRFHGWERVHPDWRVHAIRNDRFRRDARGEVHPMGHNEPERTKVAEKPKEDEHQPGRGGLEGTKAVQKPQERAEAAQKPPEKGKAAQKPKEDERH